MPIIKKDQDFQYFELITVDILSEFVNDTDDFEMLAEALSEIKPGFLHWLDILPKIIKKLIEKHVFTISVPNSLFEYFEAMDDEPIEFIKSFLPTGFDIENEDHFKWATESIMKQIEDGMTFLLPLIQSHPKMLDEMNKHPLGRIIEGLMTGGGKIALDKLKDVLPKEALNLGKKFIDGMFDDTKRKNTLENIVNAYASAFDNIITHILRPLIGKTNKKRDYNVMGLNSTDVIEKSKNIFPEKINWILDIMQPELRNATAHKNYIITDDDKFSYFISPWKNPYSGEISPLQFDNQVSLEKLWADAYILNIFQLMYALMRYLKIFEISNSIIEADRLPYILWNPQIIPREEFFSPIYLMKAIKTDPNNPILKELLIIAKMKPSRFIHANDKPYDREDHIQKLWKVTEEKDRDRLLAYTLYLIACDENPVYWDGPVEIIRSFLPDQKKKMFDIELELARIRKVVSENKEKEENLKIAKLIKELGDKISEMNTEENPESKRLQDVHSLLNGIIHLRKISCFTADKPYASSLRFQSFFRNI